MGDGPLRKFDVGSRSLDESMTGWPTAVKVQLDPLFQCFVGIGVVAVSKGPIL